MAERIKALTAVLLLLSAATSAAGQSLVATVKTPLKVAASYGYSQVHHTGEWIRVDVVVRSERPGEYWLEVDGPGDLAARLPVRLH